MSIICGLVTGLKQCLKLHLEGEGCEMMIDKIFLVIVLYKTKLEESNTVKSLLSINKEIELLVFDNSPNQQYENQYFTVGKIHINYHHDAKNPGLSVAYNFALQLAIAKESEWLLLLDQDTTFNKQYFNEIESLVGENFSDAVVAVIPKVIAQGNNKIISPAILSLGGVSKPVHLKAGITTLKISGINSGTLLSVAFMNSLNGFNSMYSLDMLDHWYFNEIFANKRSIYVMESTIFQELSVAENFEKNISISRYRQMLEAEHRINREAGLINLMAFKIRLCFRIVKQFNYVEKAYSKQTVKYIFRINS